MSLAKILLATCVLALGLSAKAFAAPDDFKGFYAGVNFGGTNGQGTVSTTTVYTPGGYFDISSPPLIANLGQQAITPNGFGGGVQAGYNWQSGPFVFGLEADYGPMNLSDQKGGTASYTCIFCGNFTLNQTVSTSWLFTARPRIGIVTGKALLYVTGGIATTRINYNANFHDISSIFGGTSTESASINQNAHGWTAGLGAETKISPHISAKGEYLFTNFPTLSTVSTNLVNYSPATAYPQNPFTHSVHLNMHTWRVGLNFHF